MAHLSIHFHIYNRVQKVFIYIYAALYSSKVQIDKKTSGKFTKNNNYKGVLRVDYFDRNIRYELESLVGLVYNQLTQGPVVYR
jgi:hypothetical protein